MKYVTCVKWAVGLVFIYLVGACQPRPDLKLWYTRPAERWEETLPLGNGRLGMMPDGGVVQETIILNDITMWSGSFQDTRNPEALHYLPEIRRLLLEGENDEAQELMYKHFSCGGRGSAFGQGANAPYGAFQLLGKLHLQYNFPDSNGAGHTDYERGLSLDKALAWTSFRKGKVRYRREYFVSQTEDVMVMKLTADRKGKLDFDVAIDRPENYTCYANDGVVYMEGQLNNGKDGAGTKYMVQLKVWTGDGRQVADSACIHVKEATTAYILVSAGTSLWAADYPDRIEKLMQAAGSMEYDYLVERHDSAWQYKYNRVELNLGTRKDTLPTDQRLSCFQEQEDPGLVALYFQFGRYLLLSGTRENSFPLNLQGLWANSVQTPWNGDYHLNINLQMNYWPIEVVNLSELHTPLKNLVKNLVTSGEVTARSFYGAQGWVAHMMTNPWHFTAPGEHASWGATNTGGAWLCEHLWEHYAFLPDREYLREIYPVLKGAARFFLSSMIEVPSQGWLVTAPSSSPENAFYMPGTRKGVSVCMGPTMDTQIIRELFSNTIQATRLLGVDTAFADSLEKALGKLPPMQISTKGGYLQEWLEDYEEVDLRHRHVSHLFGLYPSNQISLSRTPELAEAARETLRRRGDGGTGWSMAWKINFWARLQDGDKALKLLKNLLKPVVIEGKADYAGGGTYPNLLCAHPPFQIDGNLGGCAGIAEMLIQSQEGFIEVLPALPVTWQEGSFKGLCVRGGGVVDASWKAGKLEKLTLYARVKSAFLLKIPEQVKQVEVDGKQHEMQDGFIRLSMNKGEQCEIVMKY